jgi:uncharacterized phage protein gp47/JayE
MTTLNEVVSQMRSALAVTDPDLDTSIGTTTRKILDAVAESIAESYLDQHMLAYTYDVDSKIDADLDTFCQTVGGISRLAAKRAVGTVTFTRSSTATNTVFIPVNAEITSNTLPPIQAQTITGAVMLPGQLTVTVAVQAVSAGPNGNIAANSLTLLTTSVEGVGVVTNLQPLTGGMSQETDDELRARWKKTAFRSNAGTEPMYLGLALNDDSVTAAQVIGASKRRREQVQVSGGIATSVVDDCAYVFPTGVFVGPNIDGGTIMLQGVDYSWDASAPHPRVLMMSGVDTYDTGLKDDAGLPIRASIEGAVLDLDFEYTPMASRNDPTGLRFGGPSVMSRVDVWCAGKRPISAQQSVVFRSDTRFTATTTSPYYTGKFVRINGDHPTATNVFIPLAYGPIISIPNVLSIGGVTYGRIGAGGTGVTHPNAYALVHDDTPFGYTATSLFGLEWDQTLTVTTNTVFTIGNNGDYLYNAVPRAVQDGVDRWRLAGVDAKTHAAKEVSLRFSLAIMYERSANQVTVNTNIDLAISTYLSKIGLGGVVQVSDIEQVAHNVAGVDNVRFIRYTDCPGWTYITTNDYSLGIQRIVETVIGGVVTEVVAQTYVSSTGEFNDIVYGDSETPIFESAIKVVKAQNTFKY